MAGKVIILAILLGTISYFVYEFVTPPKYKESQAKSAKPEKNEAESEQDLEIEEEELDEDKIRARTHFSGAVAFSGNSIVVSGAEGRKKKLNLDDFDRIMVEKDDWGKATRWFLFKDGTKVKYSKEFLKKVPRNVLYKIDYAHFSGNVEEKEKKKGN